jgi:hypothetical protein
MSLRSFSPMGVSRLPKSKITKNRICSPLEISVWHLCMSPVMFCKLETANASASYTGIRSPCQFQWTHRDNPV